MQRVNTQEILDSEACPPGEVEASLRDLCRINRWFGGVATTRSLIERVAATTGKKHFSVLEVASGFGEVPKAAGEQLKNQGITLDVLCLDRLHSHLRNGNGSCGVVADALALPFPDGTFDGQLQPVRPSSEPADLAHFAGEASRVSRCAVLINDLIRHPMHLALVYAAFPLMRSYVSRVDGLASVRRAYVPQEMRKILMNGTHDPGKIEISRHYLFRMGVIVWKDEVWKDGVNQLNAKSSAA